MKLALSVWNERIAPLFDVSGRFLLIDEAAAEACQGEPIPFSGTTAEEKAECLSGHGVRTLICGAVSSEYQNALLDRGIETIAFIAGPIDRVLEAWAQGSLEKEAFSMPGCGCPRRRCRRRHRGGTLNMGHRGEMNT